MATYGTNQQVRYARAQVRHARRVPTLLQHCREKRHRVHSQKLPIPMTALHKRSHRRRLMSSVSVHPAKKCGRMSCVAPHYAQMLNGAAAHDVMTSRQVAFVRFQAVMTQQKLNFKPATLNDHHPTLQRHHHSALRPHHPSLPSRHATPEHFRCCLLTRVRGILAIIHAQTSCTQQDDTLWMQDVFDILQETTNISAQQDVAMRLLTFSLGAVCRRAHRPPS